MSLAVDLFCYLGRAADTFYSMGLVTGFCHLGLATGLPAIQALLLGSSYNLGLLLALFFPGLATGFLFNLHSGREFLHSKARILHDEITLLRGQIPFTPRISCDRDISGISPAKIISRSS